MLIKQKANKWCKTLELATVDLAIVTRTFHNQKLQKKPLCKVTNLAVVDNVLLTKTKCLEEGDTGQLAIKVIWTRVFLVISLFSEYRVKLETTHFLISS